MAINDRELNTKIIAAFSEYNNGNYKVEISSPKHLKILGDTIKAYFEEKTVITYKWVAVLSPPASTPDPVASFDSEATFPVFDLTAANNLITLAVLIQAAIIAGIIKHPAGFTITPGTFIAITPLVLPQTNIADDAIFNCITSPTCAWYLTCINPAPLVGNHGSYAGATTGMVIK
jgi:hypothetical protein